MSLFAFALAAGQDVARRGRLALSSFLAPQDAFLQARPGLVDDGGGQVTAVDGTMRVSVSPFRGFVLGEYGANQGVYPVVNEAIEELTVPDGGAVDKAYEVVALVQDSSFDASGVQQARLEVIDPVAPPEGSYLRLAQVTVPANRTAGTGGLGPGNIGPDLRQYTSGLGGTIPVTGTTQRNGINARPGTRVYRLDTNQEEVFDGNSWATLLTTGERQHIEVQMGEADCDGNGTVERTGSVNFPEPFTVAPYVTVTCRGGGAFLTAMIDQRADRFGFSWRVRSNANEPFTSGGQLDWVAVARVD